MEINIYNKNPKDILEVFFNTENYSELNGKFEIETKYSKDKETTKEIKKILKNKGFIIKYETTGEITKIKGIKIKQPDRLENIEFIEKHNKVLEKFIYNFGLDENGDYIGESFADDLTEAIEALCSEETLREAIIHIDALKGIVEYAMITAKRSAEKIIRNLK